MAGCLFVMILKPLPNVRLRCRGVWLGAVAVPLFFTPGKLFIGCYLAVSSLASSPGAAGSSVPVPAWIYYSACLLFFSAEITRIHTREFGTGVVPNSRAVPGDGLFRTRPGLSAGAVQAASAPPGVPPPGDRDSGKEGWQTAPRA